MISESLKMMRSLDQSDKISNMITNMVTEFKETPRMSKVTQNKILNLLNAFQSPGGPYFPPRELRQLALKASTDLFPEGQNARMLTHIIFRIAHPWYTTQSIVHHCLKGVATTCKMLCCCSKKRIKHD